MALYVGKPAPQFELEAAHDGEVKLIGSDDYRGRWLIVLFYPLDFSYVCPTELCAFSDRLDEFQSLGADIIGVSVDSQFTHLAWMRQPRSEGGVRALQFPLLSDLRRQMSWDYAVLSDQGVAVPATILVDPDGVLQHVTLNNLSVGRSVDETLRVLRACQQVRTSGEVCPVDWKPGDQTIRPDTYGARLYFARRKRAMSETPAAA
jgi:peroxiredoxin (alkyl hydroperoxide reductase subunit C)